MRPHFSPRDDSHLAVLLHRIRGPRSKNVTILGLPRVGSLLHIVCPADRPRYYLLLTRILANRPWLTDRGTCVLEAQKITNVPTLLPMSQPQQKSRPVKTARRRSDNARTGAAEGTRHI